MKAKLFKITLESDNYYVTGWSTADGLWEAIDLSRYEGEDIIDFEFVTEL